MKILFVGDVFGEPGRKIVRQALPDLIAEYAPDLIIANGENAAHGFGITPGLVDELLDAGIDALTSGNHIWDRKEIMPYLAEHRNGRLVRPANFPPGAPGAGLYLGRTRGGVEYALLNLQGRVFMSSIDCPFRKADELISSIAPEVKVRVLDIHAETTSEKIALGWYLDGRLTAIVGTHTHIPTADEHVLPQCTAYITDVGMTGPYDSVIGMDKKTVIERFLKQTPARFDVARGDVRLSAVLIEADESTGRALSIRRVMRPKPFGS
jgi:2',3'-cyclic-nucleotide 2'-phosphodiesterase